MQLDFTNFQHLYINEGLASNFPSSVEDSREIWFSIQEIEQYICYAKKESLNKGVTLNGLRVYLASKRIPIETTKDSTDFIPKTTVFFVPTHKAKKINTQIIRSNFTEGDDLGSDNKDTNGIRPMNMGDTGTENYIITGG